MWPRMGPDILSILFLSMILTNTESSVITEGDPCFMGTNGHWTNGLKDFAPFDELNVNPAEHKVLCQTNWEDTVEKKEGQYLTLFNSANKIPVFSTYFMKKPTDPKLARKKKGDFKADEQITPKQYVSNGIIDKGHLFPHRFATTEDQARATMRMTNIIPQDKTFNEQVWKKAEDFLYGIATRCLELDGLPVFVTGAVPFFYGSDNNVRMPKPENKKFFMNIFKSESWSSAPKDKDSKELAKKSEIVVPTHMWTHYECLSGNTKKRIHPSLSFIGLNYRTGVIKVYNDNTRTFTETLGHLYNNDKLKPWHKKLKKPIQDTSVYQTEVNNRKEEIDKKKGTIKEGVWKDKFCFGNEDVPELDEMKCEKANTNEKTFWDKFNVQQIREKNEYYRLRQEIQVLHMYGVPIDWPELVRDNTNGLNTVVSVSLETIGAKRGKTDIRKRSITTTIAPESTLSSSEQNNPKTPIKNWIFLELIDNDITADLAIEQCTIAETYSDGYGKEKHEIDFAQKVFRTDRQNKNKNEIKASMYADQKETPMKEEVSTDRVISIVLKPRQSDN
eukprot:GFUD01013707.1.p1 GENE.GFUD01013707.1~~GFUD01013707.1.p1  ORF type:complete len:559 (+),score=119.55 GFUD01013707.1:98-1774(+)